MRANQHNQADLSALGKQTIYEQAYNPSLLYPIPRAPKRTEIGIDLKELPFCGCDYWNHYEVSWLNDKGKPVVAVAELYYDASSPYIVESKSLKLYFNSFNNHKFESTAALAHTIKHDLEQVIGATVSVSLKELGGVIATSLQQNFAGQCIDDLDIVCSEYIVNPSFLSCDEAYTEECLYSNLLKSNCLVTNQPDWASVQISYKGNKINREGLLRYIVSFRNHNEFHEQCIERIFIDLLKFCNPEELTVYGRYTRRGGLDINPFRSTCRQRADFMDTRLIRQ